METKGKSIIGLVVYAVLLCMGLTVQAQTAAPNQPYHIDVVTEPATAPVIPGDKAAWVKAHPEEYQRMNAESKTPKVAVVAAPSESLHSPDNLGVPEIVSQQAFQSQSADRKAYMLSHPNEFKIVIPADGKIATVAAVPNVKNDGSASVALTTIHRPPGIAQSAYDRQLLGDRNPHVQS